MIKSIYSEEESNYSDLLTEEKVVLKRFKKDIPESLHQDIDEIIYEQIGQNGKSFKLPLNSGDNRSQALEFKLKMLDIYHTKFKFMNVDTPEEFIWEISKSHSGSFLNIDDVKEKFTSESYKERFEKVTNQLHLNQVDSKRILETQIIFLNQRDKANPLWICFKEKLKTFLALEDITV